MGADTTIDICHLIGSYNQPQQSHSQHSQLLHNQIKQSRSKRVVPRVAWRLLRGATQLPHDLHTTDKLSYATQRTFYVLPAATPCSTHCPGGQVPQLKIAFETYAHQRVWVRREVLAPIRSSAHMFGSDLQLFPRQHRTLQTRKYAISVVARGGRRE